jgi:hypothetical protein
MILVKDEGSGAELIRNGYCAWCAADAVGS